jgi:hypothetical protein
MKNVGGDVRAITYLLFTHHHTHTHTDTPKRGREDDGVE